MLMQYWGGLPYIDVVLDANSVFNLPRLSYQATAEKAAEDFQKAADLLPVDWDQTAAGKATLGKNSVSINKVMALAYLPPMIAGIVLAYKGKYLWGLIVTAVFTAFEARIVECPANIAHALAYRSCIASIHHLPQRQGIVRIQRITNQSFGIHVRSFIFCIESAARQ